MKLPEWVDLVKTNVAKELAPYDEDWYLTRCASIARHIYIRSPVGVSTVTKIYGSESKTCDSIAQRTAMYQQSMLCREWVYKAVFVDREMFLL